MPLLLLLCFVESARSSEAIADTNPTVSIVADNSENKKTASLELVKPLDSTVHDDSGQESSSSPSSSKSPNSKAIEFLEYVCGPNSADPSIPCGSIPPEHFYNANLFPSMGQAETPNSPKPKDKSAEYNKDSAKFKQEIERGSWQRIQPDNRTFVAFARNYANRLHCDGTISDVVYPTDKGLEIQILNNGHDVFLRVGNTVPQTYSYFPIDLNVVCNEQVYQINGVVDAKYPAMNVELVQDTQKLNEKNILQYSSVINKAEALPHEQKITKLMQRVYQDKKMQFWLTHDMNTRFSKNDIVFHLRQKIETNIDDIVAWDFAVEQVDKNINTLLESLRHAVVGEIVSIGRVRYGNGQRVVILSVVNKG